MPTVLHPDWCDLARCSMAITQQHRGPQMLVADAGGQLIGSAWLEGDAKCPAVQVSTRVGHPWSPGDLARFAAHLAALAREAEA